MDIALPFENNRQLEATSLSLRRCTDTAFELNAHPKHNSVQHRWYRWYCHYYWYIRSRLVVDISHQPMMVVVFTVVVLFVFRVASVAVIVVVVVDVNVVGRC